MVHMHTQSGGKLDFREIDQTFIPKEIDENHINVGSCNGDFELEEIINITNKINVYIGMDRPKSCHFTSLHGVGLSNIFIIASKNGSVEI